MKISNPPLRQSFTPLMEHLVGEFDQGGRFEGDYITRSNLPEETVDRFSSQLTKTMFEALALDGSDADLDDRPNAVYLVEDDGQQTRAFREVEGNVTSYSGFYLLPKTGLDRQIFQSVEEETTKTVVLSAWDGTNGMVGYSLIGTFDGAAINYAETNGKHDFGGTPVPRD